VTVASGSAVWSVLQPKVNVLSTRSVRLVFFFIKRPIMADLSIHIGINGESSFEAALMERAPGCEVWGYDFTVNSVRDLKSESLT